MTYLDLKLGYLCNNSCVHCVISDQRERARLKRGNADRSTAECKKELLASRSKGITRVTFTGGEPTIRPDFLELLEFAKKTGFNITLQSNGRMFAYPPFAKAAAAYVDRFVIALHGPAAELHDRTTRAAGSYYQTVLGIKNLVAAGAFVFGKVVITKLNYALLKKTAEQFCLLGVNSVNIAFPHANGSAGADFDEVVPSYTEIMPRVFEVIKFAEARNRRAAAAFLLDFEAIPLCLMPGREKYNAELKYLDNQYSELKQLDLPTKNWQKARKELKLKFRSCGKCRYDAVCEGVWREYPERRGEKEFKPVV